MKHKIKMRQLTAAEQAELDRLEKELIGHRPEDYPSFDEYFKNEIVIPTEKWFAERGI